MEKIHVPLSVPAARAGEYRKNYIALTNNRGHLFLIAGDQKIEHLNDDFFGPGIAPEDGEPEHLFRIAQATPGSSLAVPLGLIARYGSAYRNLTYIVKLGGKTNLGNNELKDSHRLFWPVEEIIKFKKQSGLKIAAIGYTVYLGGTFEAAMLAEAAQAVWSAHQAGLAAVIWMYPRGKNINEEDIHTIAGGAGVAASLDADFVKVKYPVGAKNQSAAAKKFREVVRAAGMTKIVCVGGSRRGAKELLVDLERQIKISGTAGLAIGRNLHQRPLAEAIRLSGAISAILWQGATSDVAYRIYAGKMKAISKKTSRFLGLF